MNKELGIYIHIPFCKQKCYYCDFTSYAGKENLQKQYIQALKKEIRNTNLNQNIVTTIYIGGGTPSYIESKDIKEILDEIKSNFNISKNVETTIEVNPGTVNEEKLKDYIKSGINRISIGLQTTSNRLLKEIGRIHNFEQFLETYNLSRKVGFKNINVDLMIGLPNQTIEMIKNSLEEVVKLNPEHISIYSLILEEQTPLEKMVSNGELELPNEDQERKMYWYVKNYLELNGYTHYEISNFAKTGYESKHNINCWKQKEYIGIGLAAHSYINKTRFSNKENVEEYIENIENNKIENNKKINEIQDMLSEEKEFIMLGLRKIEGVNIQEFKNKFSTNPLYVFRKELDKLVKIKLIEIDLNQIKLTNKGLDLANIVWEEFV